MTFGTKNVVRIVSKMLPFLIHALVGGLVFCFLISTTLNSWKARRRRENIFMHSGLSDSAIQGLTSYAVFNLVFMRECNLDNPELLGLNDQVCMNLYSEKGLFFNQSVLV